MEQARVTYYHVRISRVSDPTEEHVALDLDEATLIARVVEPYRRGRPIVIRGATIPLDDLRFVKITKSEEASSHLLRLVEGDVQAARSRGVVDLRRRPSYLWRAAGKGKDVTDEYITAPPGSEADVSDVTDESRNVKGVIVDTRKVFVVHGRDGVNRDAMFTFLRAIDLDPIEWSEARRGTGRPQPYIGEALDYAFSSSQAVVVMLTPDDEARLRERFHQDHDPPHETELTGQARANVLFEAGMAMGRAPDRTVLVELGRLRPFSDVAGLHIVRFDGSSQMRQDLAQRLEDAGCQVNTDRRDWHTAGEFEIP